MKVNAMRLKVNELEWNDISTRVLKPCTECTKNTTGRLEKKAICIDCAEKFQPLNAVQRAVLSRLIEQKKKDWTGAMGWGFPVENPALYAPGIILYRTLEELWRPLIVRGLVEDLRMVMPDRGKFFVRITLLGERCTKLGVMLAEPRILTTQEMEFQISKLEGKVLA